MNAPLRDVAAAMSRPDRRLGVDAWLVTLVIALGVAGIAISSSASVYAHKEIDSQGLLGGFVDSFAHVCLGLAVMTLAVIPDYRRLSGPLFGWIALGGVSALLVAALFGATINGANRWINVFGMSLQPSELAKPVLILTLASVLARAGSELREWQGLSRPLLVSGLICVLVLAGRDLGTTVLLFSVTLVMLFAAGVRWKHTGLLLAASGVLFAILATVESYRSERFAGLVESWRLEPGGLREVPHQLLQSLVAIGSGGLFGKGFGSSTQKVGFLPYPENDFVFAIVAEELGLIGSLAILATFLVVAWRGWRVADRSADELGRLIAIGATWLIVAQAMCHVGVVTGLLPTTGIPLPFLSTGGSSLIASFALVGLVLNVSLRRRRHEA